MSTFVWCFTAAANAGLLAILLIRRWDKIIPWFVITMAASVLEEIPFNAMTDRHTWTYFYLFYAIDLLNIGLYLATVWESWKKPFHNFIALPMLVYVEIKLLAYGFLLIGKPRIGLIIRGYLYIPNLLLVLFWCILFWHVSTRRKEA